MLAALENIVGHFGACVIALRQALPLPIERVEASADRLLELLAHDRAACLYALCCLQDQPDVLAHSIAVAGRLADLLYDEPDAAGTPREQVCAALIHDLGKALLADRSRPAQALLNDDDTYHAHHQVNRLVACLPAGRLAAGNGPAMPDRTDQRTAGRQRLSAWH